MATSISEIYDNFLSKITDYTFLSDTITQQDVEDDLFGYFKTARAKFRKCKNDLTTVDDGTGKLVFNVDLDLFEIEILTTLMLVEYIKPLLLSSEVLKQSLSDKDFKIYSQANQIRELSLLYRMLRQESEKMITRYTYFDLEDKK
jgi:hypothetical protein